MAQIDDFFMCENRVEGITDADYQRVQPYVEAAQAFAQTTYQSIYIIDYYRKNFLYVSDNPLFLCGHTADEVRQMGYGFYLSHVPEDEVPMLTELNRSGFRAFYDEPVENRRQCMMSYDFHITHGARLLLVNHNLLPKWVIFHPCDAELPIWVVDVFGRFIYFAGKNHKLNNKD